MIPKKQSWFKRYFVWTGIIIFIIVLSFYVYWKENWEEENCGLEFEAGAYAEGCLEACFVKCSGEGFKRSEASYFKDIEDLYADNYIGKICICKCEGCRE